MCLERKVLRRPQHRLPSQEMTQKSRWRGVWIQPEKGAFRGAEGGKSLHMETSPFGALGTRWSINPIYRSFWLS